MKVYSFCKAIFNDPRLVDGKKLGCAARLVGHVELAKGELHGKQSKPRGRCFFARSTEHVDHDKPGAN